MRELNETVGVFTPDKMILDPTYPQQVGAGVYENQETPLLIQRGQLLAKTEDGKLTKATSENKKSLSICLSDTMVEKGTIVEVILAGAVNANGIIVEDGEDVYNYKDDLRANNIYIKNTIGGM